MARVARALTLPFEISAAARDAVVAHARAVRPAECCGILLGAGRLIVEAVPARNLSPHPTRFLIDPKDHIDTRRDARARGLEVLGFYHSHPHSPPWPSETDTSEACYDEAVHLIVSLAGASAEARLFRIVAGTVTELALITSQ
jgi:proteasome lid subunit RPN8/RPN11